MIGPLEWFALISCTTTKLILKMSFSREKQMIFNHVQPMDLPSNKDSEGSSMRLIGHPWGSLVKSSFPKAAQSWVNSMVNCHRQTQTPKIPKGGVCLNMFHPQNQQKTEMWRFRSGTKWLDSRHACLICASGSYYSQLGRSTFQFSFGCFLKSSEDFG